MGLEPQGLSCEPQGLQVLDGTPVETTGLGDADRLSRLDVPPGNALLRAESQDLGLHDHN